MITIYVADLHNRRQEDIDSITTAMHTWHDTMDARGASHMRTAWLNNYQGLTTHALSRTAGDFLVSVHDPMTKTRHMLGGVRKIGNRIDISEVIGSPDNAVAFDRDTQDLMTYLASTASGLALLATRRAATPIGCLFAWAATNAETVTLTANTVGLIRLYERFGFTPDGGGPPTLLPLRRWDKFTRFRDYVVGLSANTAPWSDETSGQIAEQYETGAQSAADIIEALRTIPGRAAILPRITSDLDDAKFAQINKTMTLSADGRRDLLVTYKELIHWRGDHI